MNDKWRKLIGIAGENLGQTISTVPDGLNQASSSTIAELIELLKEKNGFFAFESALHVFPLGENTIGNDLLTWNAEKTWREAYGDSAKIHLFFAEDIFGEQFSILQNRIWRFSPETGESVVIAESLEEWAAMILEEYEVETGYPLAHLWQEKNGPIVLTHRLLPKIPFVLGGEYKVDNLYSLEAKEGMRFRANIAQQIQKVPDGTVVKLKVVE